MRSPASRQTARTRPATRGQRAAPASTTAQISVHQARHGRHGDRPPAPAQDATARRLPSLSDCCTRTGRALRTVVRWRDWLRERGESFAFFLRSRFPELGRIAEHQCVLAPRDRHPVAGAGHGLARPRAGRPVMPAPEAPADGTGPARAGAHTVCTLPQESDLGSHRASATGGAPDERNRSEGAVPAVGAGADGQPRAAWSRRTAAADPRVGAARVRHSRLPAPPPWREDHPGLVLRVAQDGIAGPDPKARVDRGQSKIAARCRRRSWRPSARTRAARCARSCACSKPPGSWPSDSLSRSAMHRLAAAAWPVQAGRLGQPARGEAQLHRRVRRLHLVRRRDARPARAASRGGCARPIWCRCSTTPRAWSRTARSAWARRRWTSRACSSRRC